MLIDNEKSDKYLAKKEVIASFFSDKEYKNNMTLKQIASLLMVPKKEMEMFKQIINELLQEGIIFLNKNNKYVKSCDVGFIKGIFEVRTKKYGIVIDDNSKEYYIESNNDMGAMNQDEVLISVINNKKNVDNRVEGRVEKIIKRANIRVIGKFLNNRNFGFVDPLENKIADIYIPKKYIKNAKDDDIVEVEIIKYKSQGSKNEGKIINILGNVKDNDLVYVDALYKSFGLDSLSKTSDLVNEELKQIKDKVEDIDCIDRIDKTDLKVVTIDSEDAKDLDDACFVKKLEDGTYMLSVFIADVSHYVKRGSNLDKEAISRGTSIYIPGTVIPMLPKKLSNGICSLNEGVKRLVLAVDMIIDNKGKVLESKVYKAVIKVAKRMSYEKVYKVLKGEDKEVLKEYEDYINDIYLMLELSQILYNKRKLDGSIDFDIKETKVYLDKNGNVCDIKPYEITKANKIIEEFMLITNMVIAEKFFFLDLPFIYRIHEKPDEEKLRQLNEILNNYSKSIKSAKNVHPKILASLIDSVQDEKEKKIISTVMLKTLKLAKYSNECSGHFGLAARYYTHFTSPIRRYPDLFIHRVISDYLENNSYIDEKKIAKYEKDAFKYAYTSSEAEKLATKIEREFVNLYSAIYMKRYINSEFYAIISSVNSFGIFVSLENTVEGFVSFENIKGKDFYIYDEKKKILVGKNSSKVFKIGDTVKVKLINVDVQAKYIDFEIL